MLFLIPVANLVMQSILKLNGVVLIPHTYFLQEEDELAEDDKLLLSFGMGNLPKALREAGHYHKEELFDKNITVAIIESEFSQNEFYENLPIEDTFVLNRICSQIDRELDYIRLSFCDYSRIETLPTFPGIFRGFSRGVVVNMQEYETRSLNGKVCTNLNQHGLGVLAELEDTHTSDLIYKFFVSNRKDDVYLRCRSALRRINETFYFSNKDSIFIYLVSTLEFLASKDYMKFEKVKSKIVPYLARTKEEYHLLHTELRHIYEDLRTEVVHCGKSLYEILPSEKAVDETLNRLVWYIVNYCTAVFEENISTYEGLEKERRNILDTLKV